MAEDDVLQLPDFTSEHEALQYKEKHELFGRVPEKIEGTTKWMLNFPLEAHVSVSQPHGPTVSEVANGISNGEHHGPIKSVIGNEVIQSAGAGRTVTHNARNLDVVPKEGDRAAIKYGKDGKATVTVGNERDQAKDRGR